MTEPTPPNASQPEGTRPTAGGAFGSQPATPQPVPTPWPAAPLPPAPPAASYAPYGTAAPSPAGAPGYATPVAPVAQRPRGIQRAVGAITASVLAVALFAGGVAVGHSTSPVPAVDGSIAANPSFATHSPDAELSLIEEAWKDIQDNYVDAKNLNDQDLAYAAIRGMVDAVGDEGHTSFMTAEESKAVNESLSGSFVGIGIRVDENKDGYPYVTSVIPNTPAEAAGLKRNDMIVSVDGTSTKDESIDKSVSRVRGPEGTDVTLTIRRAGQADFTLTITRKKFDLPMVSWAMIPGQTVAMIRLDQFAAGAGDAMKQAIEEARKAGATGIVLDLRGNPGGYVGEAVSVASQFLPDGVVFQSFDRAGVKKDNNVEPGGLATDIPLVVLADKSTASSAEIVSGAIQDAKRGEVVGEKTFGTGTVLGQFDLKDGSSLRIGVERWLTRNGRPIWHEGLAPDVQVTLGDTVTPLLPDTLRELTWQQVKDSGDAQLLKALEVLGIKG